MTFLLTGIQNVLFYLLLLIVGLYAGMHFFHELCPVESQLSPLDYARYWKIVDGTFMHRRMGVVGPLMVALFVLNIAFAIKSWKRLHFVLLAIAFILFIVDVALTFNEQMPINLFINQLDMAHVSSNELLQLEYYQEAAILNFQKRFWFALFSFASLCLIPFAKRKAENIQSVSRKSLHDTDFGVPVY